MLTVSIRSPSMLRETGGVIRAVFHIVFWSAALIGATWGTGTARARRTQTAIDEIAFRDLDSADQRVYRQCLEGLGEAEDTRGRTGAWPAVDALAKRGIPPFAADPIDHAGYTWRLVRDGTLVDYIGVPDPASKLSTFVIIVLEPDPGTPIDPRAVADELHHKLRDGTLLHVSIWIGSRALSAPIAMPALEDGWRRITMVTDPT